MKTALIILDGIGLSADQKTNPIFSVPTPFLDFLLKENPNLPIEASQQAVGLPFGEPGNSEVGHYSLGTGELNWQTQERINQEIESGKFYENPAFLKAIKWAKTHTGRLHLMGLVSNGGVHSHLNHLLALLKLCAEQKLNQVFIHAFTDGRDTPPRSAEQFFRELEEEMKKLKVGKIASLSGRYYAMDRDNHWERTLLCYQAMVEGKGEQAKNWLTALRAGYERGEDDEKLKPTVIVDEMNRPIGLIQDGDAIIFFNFRADRARQITKAFFPVGQIPPRKILRQILFATMTPYDSDWKIPVEVAFWPIPPRQTLAKLISAHQLTQLHLAETEKYAHVTYFFDGGENKPQPNEKQIVIPSPRVPSYDQKPEMSAYEICLTLKKEVTQLSYDFVLINFANGDMVGHTGNFEAIKKAVFAVEKSLADIVPFLVAKGYRVYITADHGNCEQAINPATGEIDKEHTINPVFFVRVDQLPTQNLSFSEENHIRIWTQKATEAPKGILADVTASVAQSLELSAKGFSGEPVL